MITVQDMVAREVHYCVSSLVSTLAQGAGDRSHSRELSDMLEQAIDLASPIDDWEEAAREAGFNMKHVQDGAGESDVEFYAWRGADENNPDDETSFCSSEADAWQEACDLAMCDPYQREVYEHWIVSDWLADKLEAKGEKVDRDFAGLTVWARTTTGQAIYCDGVIEAIHAELVA